MDREQAVKYLQSSGFSEEQIKAIEGAFTCEDAISRKELDKALYECFHEEDTNNFTDVRLGAVRSFVRNFPSVNPQKPKSEWQHDHEILKAYSDGANEVLDKIRAEIESKYESIPDTFHHYETGFTDALEWVLSIIDKYKDEAESEGSNERV